MSETSIRVLVVDDQTVVRQALEVLVGLEEDLVVVGSAENGAEAVIEAERVRPDVVLMDVNMPVRNGIEATHDIVTARPEARVLILTTFDDDASILGGLTAGACGYLTKDSDRVKLTQAIRSAYAGQTVLDAVVQTRLLALAAGGPPVVSAEQAGERGVRPLHKDVSSTHTSLTPREDEVLELIALGLRNREIAEKLFLSEATVKTHINNLFSKMNFSSRAEAVRYVLSARR